MERLHPRKFGDIDYSSRGHCHGRTRRLSALALLAAGALVAIGAPAENVALPFENAGLSWAAEIDAGYEHACAVLVGNTVRCWGSNLAGQLGYGNASVPGKTRIGDDETPASAGPVDFGGTVGMGRTPTGTIFYLWPPAPVVVSAGGYHSCAIFDDGGVRCWGSNAFGQLGYANTHLELAIGDDETLADIANVDLGVNRTATAISAGGGHTCAILDNGKVRCWGSNSAGQLGYGHVNDIGDDETPASAGYVDLGNGRTAKAIAAGAAHTCAILDNDKVRCWGYGGDGVLGYGNENDIGDDETPASAGYVDLGSAELTAKAIDAGGGHTCVILSTSKVRCWGDGYYGALGYGNPDDIGDNEIPNTATVGDVDLGGFDAIKITAGTYHTCAILSDATTRCWGRPSEGMLGLNLGVGSSENIGDDATDSISPIDLGGRFVIAITAGLLHTCAVFSDGAALCWGNGQEGALGQSNTDDIGDNETPGLVNDIDLGGLVKISRPEYLDRNIDHLVLP